MDLRRALSPANPVSFVLAAATLQSIIWIVDPDHGWLGQVLSSQGAIGFASTIYVVSYLALCLLCAYRAESVHRPTLWMYPLVAVFVAEPVAGHPIAPTAVTLLAVLIGVWPRSPTRKMNVLLQEATRFALELAPEAHIHRIATKARALSAASATMATSPPADSGPTAPDASGERVLDPWEVSKAAIDIRSTVDRQLVLIGLCLDNLQQATQLEETHPELSCIALVDSYRSVLPVESQAPSDLRQALTHQSQLWNTVLKDVRDVRTRVFAIHSLYRLAQRSRIEIASLIVGFLMVAGALQVAFRHQAAAGQNVAAYWTLDDFFVQAIGIALPLSVALALVEWLFRRLRVGVEGGKPVVKLLQWTVLKPTLLAAVLMLGMLFLSTVWGYAIGAAEFSEFTRTTEKTAESATTTNGTLLLDVSLVGTTSRTAVFLQKKPKADWGLVGTQRGDGYFEVLVCTAVTFLPVPRPSGCGGPPAAAPYRVIVMDRAHVLCLAKGDTCKSLPQLPVPTRGIPGSDTTSDPTVRTPSASPSHR